MNLVETWKREEQAPFSGWDFPVEGRSLAGGRLFGQDTPAGIAETLRVVQRPQRFQWFSRSESNLEQPMHERILRQMQERVRTRRYVMTLHADEEMDNDNLSIFDIERGILTGRIIERQKDRVTAERKYIPN